VTEIYSPDLVGLIEILLASNEIERNWVFIVCNKIFFLLGKNIRILKLKIVFPRKITFKYDSFIFGISLKIHRRALVGNLRRID